MTAAPLEEQSTGPAEVVADRDSVLAMAVSREAEVEWAARPITERLLILKRGRHLLAGHTRDLCAAISPELARNAADTRVAEILPLLAACKFLEDKAARVLSPRRVGRAGRPFWLGGVTSEVRRVPMGRVLVIAPSNYPLFLPGVQVLQALAAGNAVIWKPGAGGGCVAELFARILREAGLPDGLLQVTDESVEAAQAEISRGVDKVLFTGSAASGQALMQQLALTLTPCVAELSGCDAVFVLRSASVSRVVAALAFGMRLNGSATCMAPRRVFLVGGSEPQRRAVVEQLLTGLSSVPGVQLAEKVRRELFLLVEDARSHGAAIHGSVDTLQQPLVITGGTSQIRVANADIFAPVLSIFAVTSLDEAVKLHEDCSFGLTASIFGDEGEANALAARLTAGTVLINDLIVPTADPRLPFGGRRRSGFGTTRGVEGLLEMTTPKTILVRRGRGTRHFEPTTAAHEALFDGVIQMAHAGGLRARLAGLRTLIDALKNFKPQSK